MRSGPVHMYTARQLELNGTVNIRTLVRTPKVENFQFADRRLHLGDTKANPYTYHNLSCEIQQVQHD